MKMINYGQLSVCEWICEVKIMIINMLVNECRLEFKNLFIKCLNKNLNNMQLEEMLRALNYV